MLFWTRSVLCIGTVVVLASGKSSDESTSAGARLIESVPWTSLATGATRVCQAAPDRCSAVIYQGLDTSALREVAARALQRPTVTHVGQSAPRIGHRTSATPAL